MKTAIIITFVSIFTTATLCAGIYSGGDGQPDTPYLISTPDDWVELINTPDDWDSHFSLTHNIDLDNVPLSPVGTDWDNPFTGSFDGNGNTLADAVINLPESYEVGLFGYVGLQGLITNLNIQDVQITGKSIVGGLAGNNRGTLTNCFVTGNISGTENIGGMAGINGGQIADCSADVVVSGNSYVGGLTGRNNGTISDCCVAGSVSGNSVVGGVAGESFTIPGSLINSRSTARVIGEGSRIGGLVGYGGFFDNCNAAGDVSGTSDVGGLVGQAAGIISNCYAAGAVIDSGNNVGGLAGYSLAKFTDCYAEGNVTGNDNTGGLVGLLDGNLWIETTLENCSAAGNVSGASQVGGLVGYAASSSDPIINSHAAGQVTGSGSNIGGLVGLTRRTIKNAYAEGQVSGNLRVGGLIGYHTNDAAKIQSCYAAGDVTGNMYVGGLVASSENTGNKIWDCYAVGDVSGNQYVGGLAGNLVNSGFTHCYSIGKPTGNADVGGLVGDARESSAVRSFWDTQTSQIETSAAGIGKTTEQLHDLATYVIGGDTKWDFDNTWKMPGLNYPRLAWEIVPPMCGDHDHPFPPGDANKDCRVNLADLALFAANWLTCTAPDCD